MNTKFRVTDKATGKSLVISSAEYVSNFKRYKSPIPFIEDDLNFDDFFRPLYFYQEDALAEIAVNMNGRIILPTGCGKTKIQISAFLKDIISNPEKIGVYGTTCHRILLCSQHAEEIAKAIGDNFEYDILIVHSGDTKKVDIDELKNKVSCCEFNVTTDSSKIKMAYEDSMKAGRRLFIISTYDSIHKCHIIPKIDILNCDEAHETVSKKNRRHIEKIKKICERIYFYTATQKTSIKYDVDGNNIGGMNDEALYGPVIYSKSPRQMRELGFSLPVELHILATTEFTNPKTFLVNAIIKGIRQHSDVITAASKGKLLDKVLVNCSGSDELEGIVSNENFQEFCKENNYKCMYLSSRLGNWDEWNSVDRNEFYKVMKQLKDDEKLIIFHINILTQGIDLPNLTGTILLRNMNKTNMIQTIGRITRVHPDDRTSIKNGTLEIGDKDGYRKSAAHVMIIDKHCEDYQKEMIKDIYTAFEISPENVKLDEYTSSTPVCLASLTEEEIEVYKFKNSEVIHFFESIVIENFADYWNSLTTKDYLYGFNK